MAARIAQNAAGMRCLTTTRLLNRFGWLIGFWVWFVMGPGGLPGGPGGPRNFDGWPWGASRGPPEPPGPGPKSLKTNTFRRALLSGPERLGPTARDMTLGTAHEFAGISLVP